MNFGDDKFFATLRTVISKKRPVLLIPIFAFLLCLIIFFILLQSQKGKHLISDLKFRFGLYGFSARVPALDESIKRLISGWGVEKEDVVKASQEIKKRGRESWNHTRIEINLQRNAILPKIEKDLREEISKAGGEVYDLEWHDEDNVKGFKADIGIEPIHTHLLSIRQSPAPRIAILIDDLGWNEEIAVDILEADVPLSLAIIPKLPFSRSIAEKAREKNRDILAHIPMEPHDPKKMKQENEFLKTEMSEDDLDKRIEDYLSSIPFCMGVNNHMGSKFTEDRVVIEILLRKIKEKNLFFVDSKTSSKSIAYQLAKGMKIRTAYRNIFLDNSHDIGYIKNQIRELISVSKQRGSAIGIGHADKNTLMAIKEMTPEIKKEGIEIVPVSKLVR